MIPIVTPDEMRRIDDAALESEPVEAILVRVGAALARHAVDMMGGTYGRRVVAIAGPGLNGADARYCCDALRRRGVRTLVMPVDDLPPELPDADLVIDGAFGTGLSRPWTAPVASAPVLAVDIPSGIDGLTGERRGRPAPADRTLTMAALKPGLLFGDGPDHAGEVHVADIGLDVSGARAHLIEPEDVADWIPQRDRRAHKWHSALLLVAGSPGMTGAAALAGRAALRSGAGYVHVDTAAQDGGALPVEAVSSLGGKGLRVDHSRFSAAVVGPGLGRSSSAGMLVRAVIEAVDAPMVIDGDGLSAIADSPDLLHDRGAGVVLTPHDGEYETLVGAPPSGDRLTAARHLAAERDAVVLLKGPTTVVAHPDGRVRVSSSGDARLATAGTGDVLAGMIGGFLAGGAAAFDAASAAAFVHGVAGTLGPPTGLVASDLPDLIPTAMATVTPEPRCQAPFGRST